MRRTRRLPLELTVLTTGLLVAGARAGPAPTSPDTSRVIHAGVTYQLTTQVEPRPLRIHTLRVDLAEPTIELAVVVADDPDGAGPAEAALMPPLLLARGQGTLAFVNANAFAPVQPEDVKNKTSWYPGMHVDIHGPAASRGALRSTPLPNVAGLWTDDANRAHVGVLTSMQAVREAAGGFGSLIVDGRIVGPKDGPQHPRTAVGMDPNARWLYLVVVDGRQPGVSEGMTTHELSLYMAELGCHQAANLDGGGSSIMLLADTEGEPKTANQPSGWTHRPIPVGLCIRHRDP